MLKLKKYFNASVIRIKHKMRVVTLPVIRRSTDAGAVIVMCPDEKLSPHEK